MSNPFVKESRVRCFESPIKGRLANFNSSKPYGDSLYQEQREIMKHHIDRLNHSPDTKARILKNFEDLLRTIHFFDKPDIIPRPMDLNIKDRIIEKNPNKDNKTVNNNEIKYLEIIEHERKYRLKAEGELRNMEDN